MSILRDKLPLSSRNESFWYYCSMFNSVNDFVLIKCFTANTRSN